LLSLPPGTEMFQFPGFPTAALCVQAGLTGHDPSRVSPFGHPWICGWLAPPQGLSQLPTSFFGSRCQGIHRVLFVACRKDRSRSLWSSQGSRADGATGLPPRVEVVPGMQPDRPLEGSRPQSCTECPPAWSDDADRSCSSRGAPRSAVLTALLSSQPSTESAVTSRTYASKSDRTGSRKEVIQPHLPVRLPCYDFVPIAGPTFDGSLPYGLGHRLRVLPTFMT
jgi:hypothetical protein